MATPDGGTITVSAITPLTCTATITMTTLGAAGTWNYFLSSAPTDSTSDTMTDLSGLTAQTAEQTLSISGLTPGSTHYLFLRAHSTSDSSYTFMTTTGVMLTTADAVTVSVTDGSYAGNTSATVELGAFGTDTSYSFVVSRSSTNSSSATMTDCGSCIAQTASQSVSLTGLSSGTYYFWVRAKTSGGAYTVISTSSTASIVELPSGGTISVANGSYATSATATVSIGVLGTDTSYTYVVSHSSTNSSNATMTDCGFPTTQTSAQSVSLTGLTTGTTYYFWVRAKVTSSGVYTVISSSSTATVITAPSGAATLSTSSITQLTCTATVTMTTLGTSGFFNYFISSASTNSTSANMTDVSGILAQTASQSRSLYGFSASSTQYLFVRAQHAVTSEYTVLSTTGTTLTTTSGVSPSGGTCGTPSSVTSTSATVQVTMTTLGTDSLYNYFLSTSPTNSTGGTMTNLKVLTAQTTIQTVLLSSLAPLTTSYLFVRAQNTVTGAYTFMTTTGVTLTTLGTGSVPSGSSVSILVAYSTTAVLNVTMTTLGTNANYAYYVSWCASNSVGGTMTNACLIESRTQSTTCYPSGLPAGTTAYLFVRAKNVLTGAYTMMSASGTAITLTAPSLYYESAALTAYDPVVSDYFGYSVAVSGSYAVIGANQKDPKGFNDAGAAYVLELNGSTGDWDHKSVLYPSDSRSLDAFGCAVSVSGTYAVVGAYKSDPGGKLDAGAAYVFERNSETGLWEQTTKMVTTDAMPGDYFGISVSVNGTYAIIGAQNRTQLGVVNSGGAYVFERNTGSGVWEQKSSLFPSDLPTASKFGASVSVSGSYAIVGAFAKTGGGGSYVYERNSGTGVWEQNATLTCSDSTNATFGWSVSIDGTYAIVGAYTKTVSSLSQAGGAYTFERIAGTWTQSAILNIPDPTANALFGQSVGVHGVYAIIGSYGKSSGSGATYIYKRNSTTGVWENKMVCTPSDGSTNTSMGWSVGISGTHVFSGAYNKSVTGFGAAGGAYVYELPSGTVFAPSATISVPNNGSSATVAVSVLGTDATYTYLVSYSTTNSSSATMTDCGTCVSQAASQSVTLTGINSGTTYYFWVRSKVAITGAYTVISESSAAQVICLPSGCTLSVNTITPLTCNAAVTLTTLGSLSSFNYFISSASTNSTSANMTDIYGLLAQTASQTPALSGFSPSTTQYLFVRAQNVTTSEYIVLSSSGTTLTTTAGVAPSGGTVGTPSSVTSISATVAVTITTLGTDSIYNYFVSSSPTNSTSGDMTNLKALTAPASQTASLTLLTPSTTSYLFIRAQNVKTGSYTFVTTTGVTLTTLGTGSAPSGSTISVTSAASTTAVLAVTMTTLGNNASYVYYVSWCASNTVGGTMGNVCLLKAQTASQTVYPSGLPAGTTAYLFIRAKNVLTDEYTVMSVTGTAITLSASSIYYQAAALTAFDPTASAVFGASVAVSGSYAVIGAYSRPPSGCVYVLQLNGGTGEWEHKTLLIPSDIYTNDTFGISVSISNGYVIVGSYASSPGGKTNAGAAYAFEYNSGTGIWEEKTKLIASDAMPGDYLGYSVSVSGTYAIIGQLNRRQLGVANSGGAYVFERNSGTGVWEQKAVLFPSDIPTGSMFGRSVSMSGTYAIVGAYSKSGGGGAYVFERNVDTSVWEEKAILTCSDSTSASFGYKVGIDGTYAVATAPNKTVNSITVSGGIYMFERVSGTWTQTAIVNNPDPVASDFFGYSVSVSGLHVVVGCASKDPSSKTGAGSTYLYKRNATTEAWENKIEWTASDGLAGDGMGYSVGISDTHVFSGANLKAVTGVTYAGGAYVYELPSPDNTVPPSSVTISVPNNSSSAAVTIGVLGTDATYTYVVSYSTTNSSSATMTDCGTCVAQTSAQNVNITGPTVGTTYYFWVRSKVASSGAYTVLTSSSAAAVVAAPSGCTLSVNMITRLTCNAAVTMTTLGTSGYFNYFISSASTNSTSATMTDIGGLVRQTFSQTVALSGFSPNTTQYLFVRAQNIITSAYTVMSTTGTTLTTLSPGIPPYGGALSVTSVTSISATAQVYLTTLGNDSIYSYFVSSSPTNSTSGTMTNIRGLAAQTATQTPQLTLLAPSTTSYLFLRAQNIVTGAYTFMTTTGVTLTTLGTGNAPTGATISVTSAASTTAVVAVTMTTLGTNANYVYYVSWCSTNSTGGTMANVCLLKAQTSSQTVYPSGLPAGTSPYLFIRAKNVLTGAHTVMSASGTAITLSASGLYYEAAALTAFDPVFNDLFGSSVAVSGSYAVVGAVGKDPIGLTETGGAHVLELNGATGEWEHKSLLYASDAYFNDCFGFTVSLSGTYAVVGTYLSDAGGKVNSGAAYVFERNSGTGAWEQTAKLLASDALPGDNFGKSVCVSGTYAIVGASNRTQLGITNLGGAYIFERNSGSGVWEQISILSPTDLTSQSFFGCSVSVSGSYAIVGASDASGGGKVYVYERNSGTGVWEQKTILTCSDSTIASFGTSVCVDGTYAVIGAPWKSSSLGGAYIFERISGTWTQTAIINNPTPVSGDFFGSSVSLSGIYTVIGCYGKDPSSKANAGSAYLYMRNSTTGAWENKMQWTASDGLASDQMGYSVGISGTHVISGANMKSVTGVTQAGGAYVYELPSNAESLVVPSGATLSEASATSATTANVTLAIDTLGTDATYSYVISRTATNSSSATMTDCGTGLTQTASQTVALAGLVANTTYYLWARAKIPSSGVYTLLTTTSVSITTPPIGLSAITPLTCTATVTMPTIGTANAYNYFLCSSPTNSTSGVMTDLAGLLRQTSAQTVSVSGLSPNTTQYLFVRWQAVSDSSYTYVSSTGVALTTSVGVAPSGGTCGTPSSVTSISATVAVTLTTLGTDSLYNYFLSASPTDSTSDTMTNLMALTAQTASQNATLTLLAPSTTSYLFIRAQDVKSGNYTFMTTTGVTLTTLGTGSAPSGSTISVTSAAATTAVVNVTMTTLGTNANYVYYVSWCATNSTGGTMANACLLTTQGSSQTVYPSGLPAGTTAYLFVRAKNVLTGAYTVMSATGTAITLSSASLYYESAALTEFSPVVNDWFGYSSAVSGGCAVVGAYKKSYLGLPSVGSAYVFELNGGTGEWEQNVVLYPSDGNSTDYFGYDVSVSGTYIVVGAYQSDAGGKVDSGAAYVFERNSGTNAWEQKAKLIASDASPGDNFGTCVAVSGTYCIIGAPFRRQLGVGNSGGAYVFERNSGSGVWEQKSILFPGDLVTGSSFGYSFSVSGTYAIGGAVNRSGGGGAYIFERNSGTGIWEQKAILTCSDSTSALFGRDVSIDGTYAVVGAYFKTINSVQYAGGAYIFEKVSGTWTQTAILDNPDPVYGDSFGYTVGVSGVYAVIGCYAKDTVSYGDAGATYVYKRNSTTGAWENKIEWTSSDGRALDRVGVSVGISGTHVISGAYMKAVSGVSQTGGAYVFELPSGDTVPPSGATLSATTATSGTTANVTLAIDTLGTDATYSYVISWTATNVLSATMTDCGTGVTQTASQTVALTGLTASTTYYLWARAKIPSSGVYTLLTATSVSVTTLPIALSSITPLTCTATVTMPSVGTDNAYHYFLCSSPTNSTSGTMTDLAGLLRQTTAQTVSLSGLSPNTTQYLFVRWQAVSDSSYTYPSSTGVALTTTAGVAPSGGTCGTPSSVTSISATVAVTLTTLGTDSLYNYFVSSSPTNSTGGTMTNVVALTAQTTSQNASLTILAPSTTSYLFVRAQNVLTRSYMFMTTTGVTLTTLGTGNAPSGASISVTSKASTTAVLSVSMTTLGTNANYVYYVSWGATTSTAGTMANVCLLKAQTSAQTVYPSGLPAGTVAYLFVRAKNVLTGAYTVMNSSTSIVMSASSIYYEAAALTAFDASQNSYFGYSVAVSGSYAIICTSAKSTLGITNAGAAYAIELNGSTGEWEQQYVLYPSDTRASESFGCTVSVSGTYAVIGAYVSDPGGKVDAGAAYVFERNSGTGVWEQKTKLVANDAMPGDYFGYSVSASGSYAMVGAPDKRQLGVGSSGAAYVFELNSGSGVWEQKSVLFPSDLPTASSFGKSVSVSGSYAIAGASTKSGGGGAYIFERNADTGTWEQKAILTCSDSTVAQFGYSVSIDGTYAVVGGINKTVNSLSQAGGAYVFERVSGTWTQTAVINNPDPAASDKFGYSVSVNGVYIIIGCYNKDPSAKANAGAIYLYKRNSSTGEWENKMEWTASDGLASDGLGSSVGISGTHVISGAFNKAVTGLAGAGGAYVYELPASGSVVAPSATIYIANGTYTASATVTIGTLGTDATYTYKVSYSTINSSSATMTDCGTCVTQTSAQSVSLTGLTLGTTYYFWVRSKVTSSSAYTVISSSSMAAVLSQPSGCTLSATAGYTSCNVTVTLTNLGTGNCFNYFISSASTNSTSATMTDECGLLSQYSSQTTTIYGLTQNTTRYLFVRAQNVITSVYTVLSTAGTTVTTSSGYPPGAGNISSASSITSTTAYVSGSFYSMGSDSTYAYYISSSPTNSTSGVMTNLVRYGTIGGFSVTLTGLTPSTTIYLFLRCYNLLTSTYTFVTTIGYSVTTSAAGTTAPSGGSISVTSAASTTAVVVASMTTLGTNATYVYYMSWCATNSTGGTMVNVCLLNAQTGGQTVYTSGLPAGTTKYLFIRAKNSVTGTYTVMSSSGTSITTTAAGSYFESGALTQTTPTSTVFGIGVSMDGDCAVVSTQKSAYVLQRNSGTGEWDFNTTLQPSALSEIDIKFGWYSVSISGSYILVGAYQDYSTGIIGRGAVYVYEKNSSTGVWAQVTILTASNGWAGDYFGYAVSVSGTYAIVGAYARRQLGSSNSGGAYIFERNSTTGTWTQTAILYPSDRYSGSYFGYKVSISGTYAIVGAYWKTGGGGVYIYERNSGSGVWEEKSIFNSPDSTGRYGSSVSISGTYAIVGAYTRTVTSITSAGSVYILERVSGTWTQVATIENPAPVTNDYFGSSVSVSGTYAVVGCSNKAVSGAAESGAIYLYERNSTTSSWEFKNQYSPGDKSSGTRILLGSSVSISGSRILGGAGMKTVFGNAQAGGVYLFDAPQIVFSPSGGSVSLTSVTQTTASVSVAITTLGTDDTYTYVLSRSSTNSTGATMTDCGSLTTQTASQNLTVTGLTAGTTYYLWVRAKNVSDTYTLLMSSGTSATTHDVISYTGGSITNVLIYGQLTGQIDALTVSGGSGSYTYSWGSRITNPTVNAAKTGLASGTYSLTITDSVGATKSVDFTITQPTQLVLTPGTVSDITVYGQSTGIIGTSTITGGVSPYTTSWSTSATTISDQTSGSKTNLAAGTYTLTVQDTNGAVVSHIYTVLQPLNVISQKTDCSAFGVSDGAASVTIGGGVGPYTTVWYQGTEIGSSLYSVATSLTATPACEYLLVVTDTIGNVFQEIVTITEPQSDVNVVGVTPVSASVALNMSRDGAVSDVYTVSYTTPSGEIVYGKTSTSPSFNIVGLLPTTTYIIKIYRVVKRVKNIRTRVAEISLTTSADVISNYNTTLFSTGDGAYDLGDQKLSKISTDVVSLFNNNDVLKLSTKRAAVQTEARVVKNKMTLSAPKLEAIVLPFSQSETEDQSVLLSETSSALTVDVSYNTSTDQIVIGTSAYGEGNVFRVDGKYKVSVSSS